jgi:PDZ domain
MKSAGVLPRKSRKLWLTRLLAAAIASVLCAVFSASYIHADEPEVPITAADTDRMPPLSGSPGANPSTIDSSTHAIMETVPAIEAAPVTNPVSAPEAPMPHSPPAPVTSSIEVGMPEMPPRPTIEMPSAPPLNNPGNDTVLVTPPGTEEIPQAEPETPVAMVPPGTLPNSTDLNTYMTEDQQLYTAMRPPRDFRVEGDETSPIGMTLREAHKELKTGEETDGLLIVSVEKNSAAAKAGLLPYKHLAHSILTGAAIGASVIFAPAMVALPLIEYTHVGEAYDMIIGVDGIKVSNFFDFSQRMRGVQPGQLIYFNVLRDGKRLQIPVPLPPPATALSN